MTAVLRCDGSRWRRDQFGGWTGVRGERGRRFRRYDCARRGEGLSGSVLGRGHGRDWNPGGRDECPGRRDCASGVVAGAVTPWRSPMLLLVTVRLGQWNVESPISSFSGKVSALSHSAPVIGYKPPVLVTEPLGRVAPGWPLQGNSRSKVKDGVCGTSGVVPSRRRFPRAVALHAPETRAIAG